MKKLFLLAAAATLFAAGANATVWNIQSTTQDGDQSVPGSATLGMLQWNSDGTNGPSLQRVMGTGAGPVEDYACYGTALTGSQTCAGIPTDSVWDPDVVIYTGGTIDDDNLLSTNNEFSWTGQAGAEARTASSLFVSSILSGTYFGDGTATGTDPSLAGYDAQGFSCWNNPISAYVLADFCGNGTGGPIVPGTEPQDISNRFLADGIISVVDEGDQGGGVHHIVVTMTQSTYTNCLAGIPASCIPGPGSSDLDVKWRFNATMGVIPVPAAVWLFGSALGLLGWIRRRATV